MPTEKNSEETPEKKKAEQAKEPIKPPIDFYGVQPTFYIQGDEKNSSWVGCACTVLLGAVCLAITIFYFLIFVRK